MLVLVVSSRYNYGDPARGDGYEYANFIPALRALGHEIIHFDSAERVGYSNFGALNQQFLNLVAEARPDIVLSVQVHYELWSETWLRLRRPGGPVLINWGTDDSWRYDSFSRHVADNFDAYVTTNAAAFEKLRKGGHDGVFLSQWGVATRATNAPLTSAECTRDVSFVGTGRPERKRRISELKRRGIEVDCFGYGFPNGTVEAWQIPRLMRESRIGVNFSDSVKTVGGFRMTRQLKARTFEIPGSSTLLLTELVDGLADFYHLGSEIDVFSNLDELADRIRHYLANPAARDAVAFAGHERTIRDHTYERRFEEVLRFALGRRKSGVTHLTSSVGDFGSVVLAHQSTSRVWRLLASVVVGACCLVWGPTRGPRAARRLAFEISWRLVGKRTFSAKGLPGRLFYKSS